MESLVLSTTGGMRREAQTLYKHLADILSYRRTFLIAISCAGSYVNFLCHPQIWASEEVDPTGIHE